MMMIFSLVCYALLLAYFARHNAWLRRNLTTWAQSAGLAGQIAWVITRRTFIRVLWMAGTVFFIHFALLLVAVWLGYPVFTFFVALAGAIPLLLLVRVWSVFEGLTLTVGERLRDLGNSWWCHIPANWPFPAAATNPVVKTGVRLFGAKLMRVLLFLPRTIINLGFTPIALPLKAGAGVVWAVGMLVIAGDQMVRRIARGVLLYCAFLLTVVVGSVLDWQMGWHIVTILHLNMALLSIAVVSLQPLYGLTYRAPASGSHPTAGHVEPTHLKLLTWVLMSAIVVVTAFLDLGPHWLGIWQVIYVYGMAPAIGVCGIAIYLTISAIYDTHYTGRSGHGHGSGMRSWKKTTLNSAFIMTVVLLVYPRMMEGKSTYYWTERFIHFQFSRLHAVNTAQAQDETEGTVAQAEAKRRLPSDLSAVDASFFPSADRAYSLDNKEKAWGDRASGRAADMPIQVVPGYLNGWMDAFPSVHEPTLVLVGHEEICSGWNPSECTTALGSDKHDAQYRTVLQDPDEGGSWDAAPGRYRALLARVRGDDGYYTQPMQTGFAYVVCKPGTVQMRTNVWTYYGPIKTGQDTNGNSNGISFHKGVGDAAAGLACVNHPGQAIITIDPATVSGHQ